MGTSPDDGGRRGMQQVANIRSDERDAQHYAPVVVDDHPGLSLVAVSVQSAPATQPMS